MRLLSEQETAVVGDEDERREEQVVLPPDTDAQRDNVIVGQLQARFALDHGNLGERGSEVNAANPLLVARSFQRTHGVSPTPTDQTSDFSNEIERHYSTSSASPRTSTTCCGSLPRTTADLTT